MACEQRNKTKLKWDVYYLFVVFISTLHLVAMREKMCVLIHELLAEFKEIKYSCSCRISLFLTQRKKIFLIRNRINASSIQVVSQGVRSHFSSLSYSNCNRISVGIYCVTCLYSSEMERERDRDNPLSYANERISIAISTTCDMYQFNSDLQSKSMNLNTFFFMKGVHWLKGPEANYLSKKSWHSNNRKAVKANKPPHSNAGKNSNKKSFECIYSGR